MALPTITNNSPSAGYISWSAFGIQYNGQSFTIPAGNSNKKFIWWLYGGGTSPALMDGDVLPTLGSDDMILFLNKTGFGVLVPTAELMDGSLIVNGTILAGAISANAIQTYHLDSNVITADEIAANAVSAVHLSAGSITTDKLGVGSVGDSLVANGSFEEFANGLPLGWRQIAGTGGTITIVSGVSSSGSNSARLMTTTALNANLRLEQTPEKFIPVSSASGRKWYISARMGAGTAITNGVYLRASWYDANKVLLSSSDVLSNTAMSTTFTVYEGQVTPHASARYLSLSVFLINPNVNTALYVDEVTAREVVISAIIGDGQITAAKILAGTITADRIASNAITADKMAISDFSNWLGNGGFNMGSTFLDGWNAGGGVAVADTNFVSGRALQNTTLGNYASRYQTKVFTCEPGDQFYLSAKVKCTVGAGAMLPTLRVLFRDRLGANLAGGNIGTATGPVDGTYVEKEAVVTAPAGTAQVALWIEMHNPNGLVQTIGDCLIRRMNGGELIVDGAIIAAKIATDAVTTLKLQANAVTAEKIVANAITANHISANAITASAIKADAIDGRVIRGVTVIGGEVKTTETTDVVGARMGPTVVADNILGTPAGNFPGIGFTKNDGASNPAGMYSKTGSDVRIVQAGLLFGMPASSLSLAGNKAELIGFEGVNIGGGPGFPVTIDGTAMASAHVEFTNGNGFAVAGNNVNWDVGPLVVDAAKSTPNHASFLIPGPLSGSIQALQGGYYQFGIFGVPRSQPGRNKVRFYTSPGVNFSQTGSDGWYWEVANSTPVVWLNTNEWVRLQYDAQFAHTLDCRLWGHKMLF